MLKDLIVSVVVPIYNSEPFLDRCIKSVVDQSYKNIEIILVNDGSTDSSANLCDYYASIDKRIKVIHKTNGGLVSSRKTGLMHSTGDYVLYIDGDDWIETSLIEDYVNEAIKNDADLVISSHIVNLEGNEEILVNSLPAGVYHKKDLLSKIYPKMLYTGKFSQFGIFSYAWGKLYKRDTLLTNQLNVSEEITMGEDALCLYPTLLKSKTLVILNKPLYHYRQRADSLIKTLRTVDVHKMQKVYSDLKKAFDDAGVLDITLNQLQYYILSLLVINTEGPNPLNSLYPFKGIKSQESLVIYGGGTFGQHLYKKITNHKKNIRR